MLVLVLTNSFMNRAGLRPFDSDAEAIWVNLEAYAGLTKGITETAEGLRLAQALTALKPADKRDADMGPPGEVALLPT